MKKLIEKKKALSAELIEKIEAEDKEAIVEKVAEISEIDKEIEAKAEEVSNPEKTVPEEGGEETGDEAGEETPEGEETPKAEEVEKTAQAIEKSVKVAVEKWADAYISGEDFKSILEQVLEASKMFKEMSDTVNKIANTPNDSKQIEKKENAQEDVFAGCLTD